MPSKNEAKPTAFKNWINEEYLKRLAGALTKVRPDLDVRPIMSLAKELGPLELKARVQLVSKAIGQVLAKPEDGIPVLLNAAEKAGLKGFDLWPITQYVEDYGLRDFDLSMHALHELTKRFTAEFAIRPFLVAHEKETLTILERWAEDDNVHVRRLVSEGSRPRLPWGLRLKRFVEDPRPTLRLLEKLRSDPELYVRKSVANHLNDIAKDHPAIVIQTLKRWLKEASPEHGPNMTWITRHALRTLIKAGDSRALALLGVKPAHDMISVSGLKLATRTVRLGGALEFSFEIRSKAAKPLKLVIDYVIRHRKANGETSEKAFKLRTLEIGPKASIAITKRHPVRPITTRKYYAGEHSVELQVNGHRFSRATWHLET